MADTSPHIASTAVPSHWRRSFWTLWYGQCIAIAGLTVIVPQIPLYIQQLDGVHNIYLWSGLCLLAPAITQCLAAPLWGRIGDRWGRKWMVVRAHIGLALCLGCMAFVTAPWQFLIFRLLQGACGGVVDAATTYAGAQAPPEKCGQIFGNLQSSTAAGSLLGPLVGSMLASFWGYRPLFFGMALLTATSGLLAAFILKEQTRSPSERRVLPSFTHVAFSLVRQRRIRALFLVGLCAQTGMYGLVIVMALHLVQLSGDTTQATLWIGLLQGITWAAALVGSPWWGRRNDRVKVEHNVLLASVGCGVSIILQMVPQSIFWLMPLRFLQGFCFSALLQSIFFKVQQSSRTEDHSVRIGITSSVLVLGQVLGALAGSSLPGLLGNEGSIVCMGLFFIGGAGWLWYTFRQPDTGNDRTTGPIHSPIYAFLETHESKKHAKYHR